MAAPARRRGARAPARFPPGALEDRRLLATFTWAIGGEGMFNDPANWVDQNGQPGVPGPNDDAVVGAGDQVDVSEDVTLGGLSLGVGAEMHVESGTTTLTGPGTIGPRAELNLDAGATFDNAGSLTFAGGVINGQTFTGDTGGSGTLNNTGTLSKSGPGGTDVGQVTVNDLGGQINVSGGVLDINGGVSQGGDYTVAAGSTLEFTGGGRFARSAGRSRAAAAVQSRSTTCSRTCWWPTRERPSISPPACSRLSAPQSRPRRLAPVPRSPTPAS